MAGAAVRREEALDASASAPADLGHLRLRVRGNRRDVKSDRVGIVTLDEIAGHRRDRVLDLLADGLLDRALVEALPAIGCEGLVQVGPGGRVRDGVRPLRPRLAQRVTGRALLLEELLPVCRIGSLGREPAGAAARNDE